MYNFKTYDIVKTIIDDANDRFAPLLIINSDGEQGLEVCCNLIDLMIKEFSATDFEFEVDEDTTEIKCSLFMPEAIIQSSKNEPTSKLIPLFSAASEVTVLRQADNDGIILMFTFPGIWDRAVLA